MSTFPAAAQPILDIIRRDVPRPKELPIPDAHLGLRWNSFCPMGLTPKTNSECPSDMNSFGYEDEFDQDDDLRADVLVGSFAEWWDSIQEPDAQEAMDFIWGKP